MKEINLEKYLKAVKERGDRARVTKHFQFIGLEIATILKDLKHKSLYIKLAKEHDPQELLSIAKDIVQRKDVKNHGAYFMRVIQGIRK